MFKEGLIHQITFNSKQSTFNAFSKAVSFNQFGTLHNQDPNKNSYDYLLLIDNDMIMMPKWDLKLKKSWESVQKRKLNDVIIIGQYPGGIKHTTEIPKGLGGMKAKIGKLGGSGLWSFRTDFFDKIGFLDLKQLVGKNKTHDQRYWAKIEKYTHGKPYIVALHDKLAIHCGKLGGSVCNVLTRDKSKQSVEKIKFKKQDRKIDGMSFDEFYNSVINDKQLMNDW